MNILILGGTREGRMLADRLGRNPRFNITLSLAGRTFAPLTVNARTRTGGFGGIDGLRTWLVDHDIDAVIDATHPFAAQISKHAVAATSACGIALGSVHRPEWTREPGDTWIDVADAPGAAEALPGEPGRVFLSLGRLELSEFCARPEHTYLARTIDPPGDIALPPKITFVFARGPFDHDDEVALLRAQNINVVVSKNSGGEATFGKISAARALQIPVIMIARPDKPSGVRMENLDAVAPWLEGLG